MRYIILVLMLAAVRAKANVVIDNSAVLSSVSVTTTTAYNKVIDLAQADSASFQMTMQCAKGQLKIQQSNDGTNFVDQNVAGSSLTFNGSSLTTQSNQFYNIANPAYRYINFNVQNTSAPVAGVAAACTVNVTQCLRSVTIKSN